jgi:acetyl-CoA acetyltransferase
MSGIDAVLCNPVRTAIASGMENMDRAPYLLPQGRWALRSQQRFSRAQARSQGTGDLRQGRAQPSRDHRRVPRQARARLPQGGHDHRRQRAGWKTGDVERVEINEAFAAIALACLRELGFAEDVVNGEGGAIAHGHPIGASGAVLATRLMHSMRRDGLKRGIVTLCIGGGQGIALALESL